MFRVGQLIEKNGKKYLVVDIVSIDRKKYVLFAIIDAKINYVFYEIVNMTHNGYDLEEVKDPKIQKILYDKVVLAPKEGVV